MIAMAIDRRGKTDHRRAYPARRQCGGRCFRNAGIRGRDGRGRIFLGCDTARRRATPEVTSRWAVGAFEHGAERLDSAPVRLAVFPEFEKSWLKAVWITPSAAAAPLLRLSRPSSEPRWTSAPVRRRPPPRIGTGESEHLMARVN